MDRRPKTNAEHLYGVVAISERYRGDLRGKWYAMTGSDPHDSTMIKTVNGWMDFVKGQRKLIMSPRGLGRVMVYAWKTLPGGEERDPDREVFTSGKLQAAWDSARSMGWRFGMESQQTEVSRAAREKTPALTSSPAATLATTPRACATCGRSMPTATARRRTCSTNCRVTMHRTKERRLECERQLDRVFGASSDPQMSASMVEEMYDYEVPEVIRRLKARASFQGAAGALEGVGETLLPA